MKLDSSKKKKAVTFSTVLDDRDVLHNCCNFTPLAGFCKSHSHLCFMGESLQAMFNHPYLNDTLVSSGSSTIQYVSLQMYSCGHCQSAAHAFSSACIESLFLSLWGNCTFAWQCCPYWDIKTNHRLTLWGCRSCVCEKLISVSRTDFDALKLKSGALFNFTPHLVVNHLLYTKQFKMMLGH